MEPQSKSLACVIWRGSLTTKPMELRRGSRILVRGAQQSFDSLSPKFAHNRGVSLKIAWKLHDFEEILGARGPGPPGPPGSATGAGHLHEWSALRASIGWECWLWIRTLDTNVTLILKLKTVADQLCVCVCVVCVSVCVLVCLFVGVVSFLQNFPFSFHLSH